MAKVLLSAQNNEGPFILEWVADHRAIGFDRIIVFSNGCTDKSDKLLDALAAEGLVEHFRHEPDPETGPQQNAARLALDDNLFADGDWIMWLDLDEFLVVNADEGRLDDLIGEIGDRRGMLGAWRFFGAGGNKTLAGPACFSGVQPGRRRKSRSSSARKDVVPLRLRCLETDDTQASLQDGCPAASTQVPDKHRWRCELALHCRVEDNDIGSSHEAIIFRQNTGHV